MAPAYKADAQNYEASRILFMQPILPVVHFILMVSKYDQKQQINLLSLSRLFCTYSVNIFIDHRPACRDTEKGVRGERETGTTTRKGVTKRVAGGYLHSCSLRR
jgi:hypothetical protein